MSADSGPLPDETGLLSIGDQDIEFARIDATKPDLPTIVMLHEGLGSVAMWRDFPARLAEATGCEIFVYSRHGHGGSSVLTGPRTIDYMHDEARITLPAILETTGISKPILFGHSDGASIALIHAGLPASQVAALILAAPHVLVEPETATGVRTANIAYKNGLRERLAKYHADVDRTFHGWSDIWLEPGFLDWNIEAYLPAITAPVLAIQGTADDFGTLDQIDRIQAGVAGRCEQLVLEGCGHAPHRKRVADVLAAVVGFVRSL